MDLIQFIQNVDWVFAAVLLIGGRYWGAKYFKLSKNPDLNFLGFATLFGCIWVFIQKITGQFAKDDLGNLFLTYLFTTSFYQLLAKRLFSFLEEKFKATDKTNEDEK